MSYYIAVAAHSGEPSVGVSEKAVAFVRALRQKCGRVRVVLGGYWGLMRVVADEALRQGLEVIILPPLEREDEPFPPGAVVVKTGLSSRGRSVALARTSDALVVLGGGSGCMMEAVTAYTEAKPVYVLLGTGLPTDSMAAWPEYLDDRKLARIKKFGEVERLVEELCSDLAAREKPLRLMYG